MTTPSADERQTDWSVLPVALAFGFGMGAAGWWLTKEEPVEAPGAVMTRVEGVQPPSAGRAALAMGAAPATAPVSAPVRLAPATMVASGAMASGGASNTATPEHMLEVEFGGLLQPPLKVRPPFMNANEWSALMESARQSEQAEEDTISMVNHLRYRRLLKRWRDAAPGLPGGDNVRAKAAALLLDDLRARLLAGHLSLTEARQLLPDLLADAVSNQAERIQRAQTLASELNQAAQTRSASTGAPAPDSAP
jgi:hypothetical protein